MWLFDYSPPVGQRTKGIDHITSRFWPITLTCDFYDQVPIMTTAMGQMSVQQLRVWK